jgi:hypothetical protein
MRVGIIGTGFIADVHAAALRAAGQDIVAICGNEEAVLASFSKKWSIAKTYTDYRDIPLEILDAVHICTPPNTHYAIAKYFLEKNLCLEKNPEPEKNPDLEKNQELGKNRILEKHLDIGKNLEKKLEKKLGKNKGKLAIVCEKPLCLDIEEGKELLELVEQSETPFGVCFYNRFYPAIRKMRELLQSGELGRPILLYGAYEQEFHIPPVPYSWRFDVKDGNHLRAVSEIGSHVLDLTHFLLEKPVITLQAAFQNRNHVLFKDKAGMMWDKEDEEKLSVPIENEDTAVLNMQLQEGCRVTLALSEVSHGKQNHIFLNLICEKGRLGWDNDRADTLSFSTEKGSTKELSLGMQTGYKDCFREMFSDFYNALAEGQTSLMATPSEALQNEELCEAFYRSAKAEKEFIFSDASEYEKDRTASLKEVEKYEVENDEKEKSEKKKRKDFLIQHYSMELLEGEHTFFSECYHSPNRNEEGKLLASTMYGLYCKEPKSYSDFHKLSHEEIWTFLEGDPFTLYLLYEDGSVDTITLGSDLASGQLLQYTVPVGVMQAGCLNPGGEYALYSCTVVPAFDWQCFTMVSTEEIMQNYGEKQEIKDFYQRLYKRIEK